MNTSPSPRHVPSDVNSVRLMEVERRAMRRIQRLDKRLRGVFDWALRNQADRDAANRLSVPAQLMAELSSRFD